MYDIQYIKIIYFGGTIMITVKDVLKIQEIEKTLLKINKCLEYYYPGEYIYNFAQSCKNYYIENNRLTDKQLEYLDKYYNDMENAKDMELDEMQSYYYDD